MANMKTDKFLSLYPDDVSEDVWDNICDILTVPRTSRQVNIYFKPSDIVQINEIIHDEIEEEDEIHIPSFEIEA